ncbi:MAG: hypothetical protein LC722_08335 [Actinobacteria bacterium]|nr:hypothetical protein [Actinomycetota bacterium]
MGRPRLGPVLVAAGGGAVALGSTVPWASISLDLSGVFGLFPRDYGQAVSGWELGGGLTLSLGVALALLAGVSAIVPRIREWFGWGAILVAVTALMAGLFYLVRLRVLVLDMLVDAATLDPAIVGQAVVAPRAGTFVVLLGALAAMAGGVLLVAGWGLGAHAPSRGGARAPREP